VKPKQTCIKYQCIRCKQTWGEWENGEDFYSHGLCAWCLKVCLTPIYRKRQVEEGNFDCFAKSAGFCDQQACKYREICLRI
jgi:hypothetical protein